MTLKTADKWFSKFIRVRDADDNGIVTCISCPTKKHWENMDCGHFIKRKHMSLRFSEINNNGQCRNCNWLLQGNDIEYAKGIIKKYGEGILDLLLATKNRTLPMGRFELKHIADYYRMKFNQLKKEKGL